MHFSERNHQILIRSVTQKMFRTTKKYNLITIMTWVSLFHSSPWQKPWMLYATSRCIPEENQSLERELLYLGFPSSSIMLVLGGASWDMAKSSQSNLKDSGCRRDSRKDGLKESWGQNHQSSHWERRHKMWECEENVIRGLKIVDENALLQNV